VPLVRRLVGHAHGKKRDDRGKQVQPGVQGFRKDAQAPGADDQECLQRNQQQRGATLSSAARFFSRPSSTE